MIRVLTVGLCLFSASGLGRDLGSRCYGQSRDEILRTDGDPTKGALIRYFTEARTALQNKEWLQASERFRAVSELCPGSHLALESNYYAMVADWKRKDATCKATVAAWLAEAKSFQSKRTQSSTAPSTSMDAWVTNAQLILAQQERQANEFAAAETRLKALLNLENCVRETTFPWPETLQNSAAVWLELGSLNFDSMGDFHSAKTSFQRALDLCGNSHDVQCEALLGLSRCHLRLGEIADCEHAIQVLEQVAQSDDWRVRAALLRGELARAKEEVTTVAVALKPAVEIALGGRTDLMLLYELALALLQAHEDTDAEQLLISLVHRDPKSPLAVEARIRLARQEASRQEWEKSREYLDEAIALGCPAGWTTHARLARGQTLVALHLPEDARDDLVIALQYANDDLELETAVRLELSEVLVQLQQWDAAKEHWDFLVDQARGVDGPTPKWLATIWLHQAELQALKNDWLGAEQLVSRIRDQFPECDRRDEVDYVRARCLISKAQFDQARQLLHAIASNPQARTPELTARSWWMMGETYLMQRRYAEAVHAYEQVLGTGGSQYWRSAAWMQLGQCYELLRDASSARNAYGQILELDAQGAFSASARDRIANLPEQTSSVPIQPSARTSNDAPGSNKR